MNSLKEVAKVFLKLGAIGFGGPAAHIAMMEEEIVRRRKWLTREHFLDLIGVTNLIPGPNSTEMTMHCGYERAGRAGLFVAGICFILPAVLITSFFAWLYAEYGKLPEVEPFILGIRPAVLAIMASAILKLGQTAVKNGELFILGLLTLLLSLGGINEIAALLGAGILGMIYFRVKPLLAGKNLSSFFPLPLFLPGFVTQTAWMLPDIFWKFMKIGAVLYGSGYVLFAYLDAEFVRLGWLTRQQLMDAVAVGQITPGPLLSAATFIGYQLNGFSGALLATAGVFLPSFVLVLLLNPFIPKMRRSKLMAGLLDSVNVAAVAVMASVLFKMAGTALFDWRTAGIAGLSFAAVFGFKKISGVWIVLGGSLAGRLLCLI